MSLYGRVQWEAVLSVIRRFCLLMLLFPGWAALAQPSAPNDPTFTFFQAIQRGDIPVVTRFLDRGMSVDARLLGIPALYFAQMSNQPESMKVLIKRGADVHARYGPVQRTALHDAALKGRTECVRLLLEAGADPNAANKYGHTPLSYAINPPLPLSPSQNSAEIAALLREHGAR